MTFEYDMFADANIIVNDDNTIYPALLSLRAPARSTFFLPASFSDNVQSCNAGWFPADNEPDIMLETACVE